MPHPTPPSETYLSHVLDCLAHAGCALPATAAAADDAAERLAAGGRCYLADDETLFRTGNEETRLLEGGGYQYPMHEDWGGFVAEGCDRAEIVVNVRAWNTRELTPLDLGRSDGYVEFACLAEAMLAADEFRFWAEAQSVEAWLAQWSDYAGGPVREKDKLLAYWQGG